MNRSIARRIVLASAAMLLLVGAGTFAVPAYADNGTRDSVVGVFIGQPPGFTAITVGGQLVIRADVGDDSGKCINFLNCDQPTGTIDVTFQNADLSYNQPVLTSDLVPDGPTGGQVQMTIDNPLPAGTYHVDAHYYGDDNFHANDGTLDNVVVAPLTPDIGITQSSTSSYQGDPVTFSASVSSPNGVHPTGTVQLIYGLTAIGSPITLDSSGNASITRTDLPVSDSSGHTYYFHYAGNYVSSGHGFLDPADSASLDHQTLATTPTTTTVNVSTPVRQDDPVTLSAGVSAAGGVQPPGTVRFTALLGGTSPVASTTATLSGGVATSSFAANTLLAGPYTVVAQYLASDPSYATSSAGTSLMVTPAVPLTGLGLAVTAAPNPGGLGSAVTLHVVATAPTGSTATAAGVIGIATGATALGSCTLAAAGAATTACDLITTALPAGADPITATFPGSSHFAVVSASTSVTVTEPSTTTLTASPSTATAGDPVTLTAQVSPAEPVAGEPTGTVEFRDGGVLVGSAVVAASGTATLTTSTLSAGTRTIVARYGGDAVVGQSQSAPTTVTIRTVASSGSPTSPPTSGHPTGHPTSGHPASGASGHPAHSPTATDAGDPDGSGSSSGSGLPADTGAHRLVLLSTSAAILLVLGAALTMLGHRRRPVARHR